MACKERKNKGKQPIFLYHSKFWVSNKLNIDFTNPFEERWKITILLFWNLKMSGKLTFRGLTFSGGGHQRVTQSLLCMHWIDTVTAPPLSRREPGGARQVARSFELHQRTSPKEFLQFNGSAVHDLLLTRVKTWRSRNIFFSLHCHFHLFLLFQNL